MIRAAVLAGIVLALPAGAQDRRTGYDDMSPALQAMQDDPMNPAAFWLIDGEALWSEPAGTRGQSCADCHDAAEDSMAGVAARYPAWDEEQAAPVDLNGRIALCRDRHQGAGPQDRADPDILALLAYVTHQSRGMPLTPDPDPRLDPARARGETLFTTRMGQLNLSCAQCHDDNSGGHLAAALIPQGHPTGYPQYRLEWETLGTLERRIRGCLTGVRAEPFAPGSADFIALALYLQSRAAGLQVETLPIRP
ncbi:sulfur oxidation c-type cytochrome SoxA [Pararhodobacter zhoushanensis]|uniref:sulfur oxidation c-type cytochrome SoxA n=1 Tax=Pararhodobacter zhoushanensis TaxID=2479545 RepID=UPI000F8EC531|nr:sulfur oxidation c-type cytochrome SoxA [Pararhodobacter zhoushanensis]